MKTHPFAGPLLRLLRLRNNWSQETLCNGICAVSYLSKIEQGRAEPNDALLTDLFSRLGASWNESSELTTLRDELYEGIFSWNDKYLREKMAVLEANWDRMHIGPCYADFTVIRAYVHRKTEWIPNELEPLLDPRQRALLALLQNRHKEAHHLYPCPLTALSIGEEAFWKGNYTLSLEYYQMAYDQAAREGYAHLMLYSQHFMAASYSNMGNLEAMYRHSRIAERLGRALGETEILPAIHYNIAATQAEYGDYEQAYAYFSGLEAPDILSLHKLAVCCEALGKREEALAALDRAETLENEASLNRLMCSLVRYRLEHPDYLHDPVYGEQLLSVFEQIRKEKAAGFARFHLSRVTEWLTANRLYRKAYEVLHSFPEYSHLSALT